MGLIGDNVLIFLRFFFCGASILCSLFIILTVLFIRYRQKHLGSRMSFLITMWVAVTDLAFSVIQIVSSSRLTDNDFICTFSVWGYLFCGLLSVFFTVVIAVNLQMIFVHERSIQGSYEKWYFMGPFILALIITTVPIAFSRYGRNTDGGCWIINGTPAENFYLMCGIFFGWIGLGVLYCIGIVITVSYKLWGHTTHMYSSDNILARITVDLAIRQAVRRILLYPIVPVFSQAIVIVVEIHNFLFPPQNPDDLVTSVLLLFAFLGASIQGVLNGLAFCFDPALSRAYHQVKGRIWRDKVESNVESISQKQDIQMSPLTYENFATSDNDLRNFSLEALSEERERIMKML